MMDLFTDPFSHRECCDEEYVSPAPEQEVPFYSTDTGYGELNELE